MGCWLQPTDIAPISIIPLAAINQSTRLNIADELPLMLIARVRGVQQALIRAMLSSARQPAFSIMEAASRCQFMVMSDQTPLNRRNFFRQGLFELLKPLAQTVRPIAEMARELEKMDKPEHRRGNPPPRPAAREAPSGSAARGRANPVLRPPGAIKGAEQFASACTLCNECVKVCPAEAIHIDPTGQHGEGLPYINPDVAACVVCDGLKCMTACPTGALLPTPLVQIDMGTATWRSTTCLRHNGEDCTLCIDVCPLGSAAIELIDGQIVVKEEGCIGCGLCQNRCPTQPKSIVVIP